MKKVNKTYRRKRPSTRRRVVRPSFRQVDKLVKKSLAKTIERKVVYKSIDESALETVTQLYAYDPLEIVEGYAGGERVGTEILLTGIHLRGFIHNNSTNCVYARVCMVKSQYDENITSASTIFQGAAGGRSALAGGLNALYQPFYKGLINPLWSHTFKLSSASSVDGNNVRMINRFVKLNQKIKFSGANYGAGTTKPRYHLIIILGEAADDTGVGSTVETSFTMRAWYQDS